MSNPSKQKGTSFETAVVNYFNKRPGTNARRLPLHGGKDCGDVEVVYNGKTVYVIECKNVKTLNASTIKKFEEQTLAEAKNYYDVYIKNSPTKIGTAVRPALAVKLNGSAGFLFWHDTEMSDLCQIKFFRD